ncbi:SIR2 family protein [Salmonella enterica subsp. enterica serovar Stanleyville]|uniref:SIR2 family protein n=2 Tax=Enterobacteriaceae TaxID=543 RepID=UPI0008AA74CC|nr:SIR2 family protein [Salmonella enterica]EBQ9566644.1 SIR2 family protein [Salmonella enterica subsp. enterica serovar Stanleyville]AOZ27527.1 SIR2 family protein [Salmonella enterica subsp. enterica serovar Saintpaul str. SARA26]EBS3859850.1 SIR2 family protein [Salmonella enterica subsp. enterica serovar Stanleyville]EBV1476249.1 SIR2 family protein [Salmonella enterica subsp. enterica serovar Stanleyville]ECE8938617.1 SIR2 family protein [Salmonella enterica subsp. enterica serovar Stanl
MEINEFIAKYRNHPVLFIGTGFSLRYLSNSYDWNGLLSHICFELTGDKETYLDIKSKCQINGEYKYDKIASDIERKFNETLSNDRNGKFKEINDIFYKEMDKGINLSRFKIYITQLLSTVELKEEKSEEIAELIKMRKNIGSIITTNYDLLIEQLFEFEPLIGNSILLSNPYGSVYKIHGCVSAPYELTITEQDYDYFDNKYELIRAQLLSLFIHNPVIFIGYSISDRNIQQILKTIFSYVPTNSDIANKIRSNFLLVEYEKDSRSTTISEHDIYIGNATTIRINKIKTDDYASIYKSLSDLILPVSAMDIRKVQKVWNEIKSGGEIEVKITEDLDQLKNGQMVLAVGSHKRVKYEFQTKPEMMQDYFKIVEEANKQLIILLNKQKIQSSQFFPIFAFSEICPELDNIELYKDQQRRKLADHFERTSANNCNNTHSTISEIIEDKTLSFSKKDDCIFNSYYQNKIKTEDVKAFLVNFEDKNSTSYRRLLCLYDFKHSL